jgi:hypothetical protein
MVRETGMTPASFRNGHNGGILKSVDLPRKRGYRLSVAIRRRPSGGIPKLVLHPAGRVSPHNGYELMKGATEP